MWVIPSTPDSWRISTPAAGWPPSSSPLPTSPISYANCEPIAHQAVIRYLGHQRLLYGSDLPVSHMRGRSLGAADSFLWLYEDTPVWGEKHQAIKPVLVGLEHLRSLKWACWSERLSDTQIEDIFWNNAAALFGVG